MLDKFLDGEIAVYVNKKDEWDFKQAEAFYELIQPHIKTWAFCRETLFGYIADESSGPYHFVENRHHLTGAELEYLQRNSMNNIVQLGDFLNSINGKEVSREEYLDVLFGA